MRKQTELQKRYFDEVIRLHYDEGMGEDRISRILPIGHTTASRWITIFAEENNISTSARMKKKNQKPAETTSEITSESICTTEQELNAKIRRLEKELLQAQIKAEALDEMINVAEAKFNVPIRKKAGAKQ